uniref:Proline dehydrogenase n=1 Tax=Anopheles maculatus TaxID=74869 RepID=A0A182TCH7_9DIPT
MAFLRTVSRCNSLVPRKVTSPSATGNGCLTYSKSEQFLRQYGIHAAGNRGPLPSALLAALNHRLALEGHSLDGARRWRSTTVAAASPVATGARQRQEQQDNNPSTPQRDPLDVSFNDPHAAFKSKTTFELIRAYFVYVLCSSEFLVENNMKSYLNVCRPVLHHADGATTIAYKM